MTINSVTSNSGLYEAMIQQAAALRAAQEAQPAAAQTVASPNDQRSAARPPIGELPRHGTFAHSLSAQSRLNDQRALPLPPPTQPDAQQLQKRVAGTYRNPWSDTNSLVVQTRHPGALAGPTGNETAVTSAGSAKADGPKPTFVEVHSVYVDAADEEAGRSSRNPLFQFASQLYQNVVATSRRSAAGEYIGASFSSVA